MEHGPESALKKWKKKNGMVRMKARKKIVNEEEKEQVKRRKQRDKYSHEILHVEKD